MKRIFLLLFTAISFICAGLLKAQYYSPNNQGLDVSMFWKKSGEYVNRIESDKGNLYHKLGHHGPAIENLWVAYRVYFNDQGSVDIFSKFQPRLELKATKWYPNKSQREEGFGSDNYLAGKTTGLGGVKLWNADAIQNLGPVTKRTSEVILNDSLAQIRVTSLSIPYKDDQVDIEFTVTTHLNSRHAVIEVRELRGTQVQFVTGLPIHPELKISKTDDYIVTWGDYASHERHAAFNVGTALLYNPDNFQRDLITEKEHLLISKPTAYLKYFVSSSNDKENSELNNYEAFETYVQHLLKTLRLN